LGVSRCFAEKSFRKSLGHSILEEIQTRRLERICSLLRETSLPIGEIGRRCGYSTEPYLKRLFKRTFGMTMREYRKLPRPMSTQAPFRTGKKRRLSRSPQFTEQAQVDSFQKHKSA
jgi:AraC-like DNA-binding protein